MESPQSQLDILQYGFHALAEDFMSLDVDTFIQVVSQLMDDLKDIAYAFLDPNPKEFNDRKTVREYARVLQLMDFDAKLAHCKIQRDLEFRYPWRSTKDFEQRFKMLELYIQAFADTMVEAGSSMSACTPPLTELVTMFESLVQDYLKHRHRRIALQLDPQVKSKGEARNTFSDKQEALRYVSRPFSQDFITGYLRAYRRKFIPRGAIFLKVAWDDNAGVWALKEGHGVDQQVVGLPSFEDGDIEVIMIEVKELLNSLYKAEEQYDEGNVRTPHPCLEKCNLDFLDREEGVLHWSLGGVLAWRFYGEDSWMDRYGHVIVDDE